MKHTRSILLLLLLWSLGAQAQTFRPDAGYFRELEKRQKINLPDWGPYSKTYAGISHIANYEKGLRFDLSVFPNIFGRSAQLPDVNKDSGYYPWEATSDLSHYAFRHQLYAKLYAEVSYEKLEDNARLVRTEIVNSGDLPESVSLNLLSSMNLPEILPATISLPQTGFWVDGMDYERLQKKNETPEDKLVPHGWRKGQIVSSEFVNGTALARGFGKKKGDRLIYAINFPQNYRYPVMSLRLKVAEGQNAALTIKGTGFRKKLKIASNGSFQNLNVEMAPLVAGKYWIAVEVGKDGGEIVLDGIAICEKKELGDVKISPTSRASKPEIGKTDDRNITLKYPQSEIFYGIRWYGPGRVSSIRKGDDINQNTQSGQGGDLTLITLKPVTVPAGESKVVYSLVFAGNKTDVERLLNRYAQADKQGFEETRSDLRKAFVRPEFVADSLVVFDSLAPERPNHDEAAQILLASARTNIVFPVFGPKSNILRYASFGKTNGLDTWTAGTTGIGLAQTDTERAVELLETYLAQENRASAFVHQGALVPTQFYLYQELWNSTHSWDLLRHFYPKLLRYYDFLCEGGVKMTDTGLPLPWDYTDNSGGWTDYPAQDYAKDKVLLGQTAPAILPAHLIRISKIMKQAADMLNKSDDKQKFDKNIKTLSKGLNDNAWDKASGYYGYLVHDSKNKRPIGVLRNDKGENLNMGLDGAYPIITGECDKRQTKAILANLKSESELWSPTGLRNVSQSASYCQSDRRWNGAVSFAHQWFFWKSMLDLGETEFAAKIAETALTTLSEETASSHNVYGHYLPQTGRGFGYPRATGYVSPALSWHQAYFTPGTVTGGFDCWTKELKTNEDATELEATVSFAESGKTKRGLVISMNSGRKYEFTVNDNNYEAQMLWPGTYTLSLPKGTKTVKIGVVALEIIPEEPEAPEMIDLDTEDSEEGSEIVEIPEENQVEKSSEENTEEIEAEEVQ
ncbi:hypothetical protein FUAX_44060 (plasmid) [Fulvitalea axinellae]|uniref:Mannosylglycerate hydrolase MGH1-like glycoside hydrolase domain-containing protein n=1 Tax=Fulvitalea axinellae TaxID=1182444 RepID=A0AAU9DBW4_9BACT|nr:hypothetical protein FUAX_44060 [Fulvitalea axinellae]